MEIIDTNSGPDYIHTFIESNILQLTEIHDKEKATNGEGILYCKCSDKDNKLEYDNYNEICDQLAVRAAEGNKLKDDTGYDSN